MSCIVSRTDCAASRTLLSKYILDAIYVFNVIRFNFYHRHWLCNIMEKDILGVIELWSIIFEGFRQFFSNCINYS